MIIYKTTNLINGKVYIGYTMEEQYGKEKAEEIKRKMSESAKNRKKKIST